MRNGTRFSVMIASSNSKFDQILTTLLPSDDYGPVEIKTSAGAARRALLDKDYDILIVNSPLKDENGVDLAVDIAKETNLSVLLLVDAQIFDEVSYIAERHGVLTLAKPTSRAVVTQSLRLMCATRNRLRKMERQAASFEEKIKEIKLINRAKLLLMEKESLDEETAHKFIEKLAMDSRSSKGRVAEEILLRYKE